MQPVISIVFMAIVDMLGSTGLLLLTPLPGSRTLAVPPSFGRAKSGWVWIIQRLDDPRGRIAFRERTRIRMDSELDQRPPGENAATPRPVGRHIAVMCRDDLGKAARLETGIAQDREQLHACFRLVYENYVSLKYIVPSQAEMMYQRTFGLPTSRTIVARDSDRRITGTLTVVGDNSLGLQIETTYSDEVDALRAGGCRLAEVTCLATHSDRTTDISVFFALTRFLFQYATWAGYSDLLLAIHPRHARVYTRFFGAVQFGPVRPHRLVRGSPAVACRIDLQRAVQYISPVIRGWYVDDRITPGLFETPAMRLADHKHFCAQVGLPFVPGQSTDKAA